MSLPPDEDGVQFDYTAGADRNRCMAGGAFHRAMSRAMVSTTADAKWTYHHMSGVPRSDPSRKVTAKQPLIAWLGTPGTISFNWSKAA